MVAITRTPPAASVSSLAAVVSSAFGSSALVSSAFASVLAAVVSAAEPPQAVNYAAIKAAVNASTYFFIMLSPLSALLNHAYVCININSVTFYIIDTFFIFARGNF